MSSDRPVLICLTPIRNEAWILDRFLRCAALWADHIVVADQRSEDASADIARRHPKVALISNDSPRYDEGARQRLLLAAARRICPDRKRVLIALDADEALSGDFTESAEWRRALEAPPGTTLRFQWANVLPGHDRAWIPPESIPFGFIDDGSDHQGQAIHSTRIPTPPGAAEIHLRDVKVLHYQYTHWDRMKSKQRWYQMWERLNHPAKRPVSIYRQYNHMDGWPDKQIVPMRPEWCAAYAAAGIDMTRVEPEPVTWWDKQVLDALVEHGTSRFRKIALWDCDWAAVARKVGRETEGHRVSDPRGLFDRLAHRWLAATQKRSAARWVRWTQRALIPLGW